MSTDIGRLVALVRTDLDLVKPIIETGRLDDLTRLWLEWRSEGLPASSMKGVIRNIGMHSDPTGRAAAAEGRDPGDKPLRDGIDALEQIDAGLRALIRLNEDAPLSAPRQCITVGCANPLTVDGRSGLCSKCRKRRQRAAA